MRILAIIYAVMLYVMAYAVIIMHVEQPKPVQPDPSVLAIIEQVQEEQVQEEQPADLGPYLHSEEFRAFWAHHKRLPTKRKRVLDCADFTDSDLIALACNIYHEGRGEPLDGQLAIANVTLNRVGNDSHPDTVAGVVWERVRGVPQFSWTKDGRSDAVLNVNAWERSVAIARFALEGELRDTTAGSIYYHRKGYKSRGVRWIEQNLTFQADIGRHRFYGI